MKKAKRELEDLALWQQNPRKISKKQQEILEKGMDLYGDLGGIVFNRRLGVLVGGNQRRSILSREGTLNVTKNYEEPTRTGTVADGFIEFKGERFSYREVDWDEKTHAAAGLMANEAGGEWEMGLTKQIFVDLDDGQFDLESTGFEIEDIERMMLNDKEQEPRKVICPNCEHEFLPSGRKTRET